MPRPPQVLALGDLDANEVAGITWRPIRRAFGVTAFGVNAYSARSRGDVVIEEHDELGTGSGRHEELYLVVRGSARFTIDGAVVPAPAETLVFVPDPSSRRGAVAESDDTIVVVIGGPPGAAGPPSPFEYYFAAAPAARRGDHAAAAATIADALEHHPDNERVHYELACQLAMSGELDAARRRLRRAIRLNPENAEHARKDDDLAAVLDVLDEPPG